MTIIDADQAWSLAWAEPVPAALSPRCGPDRRRTTGLLRARQPLGRSLNALEARFELDAGSGCVKHF